MELRRASQSTQKRNEKREKREKRVDAFKKKCHQQQVNKNLLMCYVWRALEIYMLISPLSHNDRVRVWGMCYFKARKRQVGSSGVAEQGR